MKARFADVRDRLRFVEASRSDYDLSRFPDFLFIGPQRTGTTWLHWNLINHPEVYVPVQKELYFWNNLEYPELHPSTLPAVEQELQWYLDWFEIADEHRATREAECREAFGCGYDPRVAGEGSATYAASLHAGVIGEILLLNPDVKVIAFVRDPVERAWSHAKKDLAMYAGRSIEEVGEQEWLEYCAEPYVSACGFYTKFLDRWACHVPEENLLIAPFADVASRPCELLTRVLGLLGVSTAPRFVEPRARAKVLRSQPVPVPPFLRRFLEDMYRDEITELRARGWL